MTLPVAPDTNLRPHITMEQIVSIMRQRRSQDSILIRQMIEIRDRYNGDVVLPVPDVDKSPTLDIPTPRLIAMAIDSTAQRAASPKPTITCPWVTPASSRSRKAADVRRKMLYAKWYESQLDIKLYRFYRQLAGYGTAAIVVVPDNDTRSAKMELRDPLTAYPELRDPSDIREPRNVGFVYGRSIDWITAHFPEARFYFENVANKEWDTLWDIVEWIDEWEIVIGIIGPRMPAYAPQESTPYGYAGFELLRYRNRAGMVPVAMPRRVTLDRVIGQISTMIDTVDLHARMTALEVLAAERHVFADLVMLSDQNGQATLVSGNWKDGRTGEVNVVDGARGIQYLTTELPPFVPGIVQGLEDAIRESGGANPMFGGDNPDALRTGRALSVMGSFAIDPRVEELQRIAQHTLSVANRSCIEVEKGYYPRTRHVCFTGLQGDDAVLEYTAADIDSTENVVTYPIPGADVSQMSVALAQLQGSGLISKHTARVKHPLIDDAAEEESAITVEQIEGAILAGFGQQVAQGAIPLATSTRVLALVRQGATVEDAVERAHKEAQAAQAAEAPPPGPGQTAAPETQPGLTAPPQPAAPLPAPAQGLANFQKLASALRAAPPTNPTNGPPGG